MRSDSKVSRELIGGGLVERHAEFRGEFLTKQMQFMRPVSADELDITVQLLAQRTTIDFWRVEI